MTSLFQLPEELLLSSLFQQFPCREHQIRSLTTLTHPDAAPCRNLVLYGTEATGKSAIIHALLQNLHNPPPSSLLDDSSEDKLDHSPPILSYAIVNSVQCITARHLYERALGAVADALDWTPHPKKCESISQLTVDLSRMLRDHIRSKNWRFVLVFDSIDRQREAPPTLHPALARLSEVIPNLTCVFIVTNPVAGFLRNSSVPHIHFPNYTKPEFVKILNISLPPTLPNTTDEDIEFLWPRFCAAVHDALTASASRTLPSMRRACETLWPRFTASVVAGAHGPREVSKLIINSRMHFQDESLLNPSLISLAPEKPTTTNATTTTTTIITLANAIAAPAAGTPVKDPGTPSRRNATAQVQNHAQASSQDLATLLPTTARLLLLAAYLASHNSARHDLTLFSTYHHGRKKRRGGGYAAPRQGPRSKHRKIARKLLGAHAFVMERMMAIFAAVRTEWTTGGNGGIGAAGLDGDLGAAIATLSSLRLLVRVGASADVMDRGGKWRINVGWEVIRGVGRSIGVEVEDWLVD